MVPHHGPPGLRQSAEDMPLPVAPRRDSDRPTADRPEADAAERLRSVRERLEAAVSGLGELDYLRQRQEQLVRAALEQQQPGDAALSSEEKLLEENILLLRKQLVGPDLCLVTSDLCLPGMTQVCGGRSEVKGEGGVSPLSV